MPTDNPSAYDYLAVVSEWSSPARGGGGQVGNAYPLFNLSAGTIVDNPQDEFANAGAIFLMNRAGLQAWDFIRVRPRYNDRYKNQSERDCCYIPYKHPTVIDLPTQLDNVAVLLNHPTFDATSSARQLLNPNHNVTPVFFVQRGKTIIGPLLRTKAHLSPMEDVQRIDWRAISDDGIAYEFTESELNEQGVRLVDYDHPNGSLNRVIAFPITLIVGPVLKVTSDKPIDVLPEGSLLEWYLQRCPSMDIPAPILPALKAAFRGKATDNQIIQQARLQRIGQDMINHADFQGEREKWCKQHIESEKGQQRIRELIEQTVAKKALEIQDEVDRRQSDLAAKRNHLDAELAAAQKQHQEQLKSLAREEETVQERVKSLEKAEEELHKSLTVGVRHLAAQMAKELPLFAALTAARGDVVTVAHPAPTGERPLLKRIVPELRPIQPTAPVGQPASEAKLVQDLHADLGRQGLHFARDFVANVYVCLKANPLNLMIGPPGYGKSMLVTALSRSLGHADAFLRIAVQRSWSEDRHLLGFYDSFHGRYDPGTSGLVSRLLQADADWKSTRQGIYLVLLDEFNLAAPEYYFSQMLQVLPSDEAARSVVLYDNSRTDEGFPGKVALNPNLRVWGTINYDETTERLSPRLLDRTGMIFLGEADVKQPLDDQPVQVCAVPASALFENFLRTADDCPEVGWELIAPVLEVLRSSDPTFGPRVELSPRVRQAIKQYLANSEGILETQTAVDFAVQQRILPSIRGRGEGFISRMNKLKRHLSDANLTRSALHVEEAIRRSEQQFGDIDFLSY